MADWYYAAHGARVGPKSEDEMRRLVEGGIVPSTALCWTSEFGSDWKSISETNLDQSARTESGPPALPPQAVNNVYAWLFAAVPLIGAIIELVGLRYVRDANLINAPSFFWVYWIAYAVFAGLDTNAIRGSGNRAPASLVWCLLPPVYLWIRANRLRQSKSYFWAWVACGVLAVVVDQPLVKSNINLGTQLPDCNSAVATDEVSKLFAADAAMRQAGTTAVEIKEIVDGGVVNDKRVCNARVLTSANTVLRIHYEIGQSVDHYVFSLKIQ